MKTGTLVREPTARLRLMAGLFAVGFLLSYLARPRAGAPVGLDEALRAGAITSVVVGGLLVLLTRRLRDPRRLAAVALTFELLMCVTISLTEHWPLWPSTAVVRGISWSCVVLVVFPWVVQVRPTTTLSISLAVALSHAAILYLLAVVGRPIPPFGVQAALLLPPFLCAGAAFLISQQLHEFGSRSGEPVRRVGVYALTERLGRGGMGEVWRARHEHLVREAAVKYVHPERVASGGGEAAGVVFRRFEREARATAQLTSAHTVRVFDYGYAPDGAFYYAMELLDGLDLETLVQRYGPQPEARVVQILLQICDSLAEAHGMGLVHRDVKPANIQLCRLGVTYDFVKVLDFGLVLSDEDSETRFTRLTQDGLAAGTPAYMAPEMARAEKLDARADVYGVGCVAYFLLTGRLVFESKSPMKMLKDHVQTSPQPPSARLGAELHAGLEALVLGCLEKDPGHRPQSAEALAEALRTLSLDAPWGPAQAKAWWDARPGLLDA